MSGPAPYGDPVTAPFWAAAARHELLVLECRGCGARQFTPRRLCLACGSEDVGWLRCAEGPRLLSRLVGEDPLGAAIGDPVVLEWEAREEAPPLPVFRRA